MKQKDLNINISWIIDHQIPLSPFQHPLSVLLPREPRVSEHSQALLPDFTDEETESESLQYSVRGHTASGAGGS